VGECSPPCGGAAEPRLEKPKAMRGGEIKNKPLPFQTSPLARFQQPSRKGRAILSKKKIIMNDNKATISIESTVSRGELFILLLKNKLYTKNPLRCLITTSILEVPIFVLIFWFSVSYLINEQEKQRYVQLFENFEYVTYSALILFFILFTWFIHGFIGILNLAIMATSHNDTKTITEIEYGEKISSHEMCKESKTVITTYFKDACFCKVSKGYMFCGFSETSGNRVMVTHIFPTHDLSNDEMGKIISYFPETNPSLLTLVKKYFVLNMPFAISLIYTIIAESFLVYLII
jgi:hypothetical protein